MADNTIAITAVKNFVNDCLNQGVKINSAWLFGSYAKGYANENSDIDVALISDSFTLNFLDNNHKTAKLNFKYPDIEVHHFNSEVFQTNDPFINEIKKSGIKIY